MDSKNSSKQIPRIRILSVGNPGVGKSCLIKRYCEKRFIAKYIPTIGIDYGSTTVEVDSRKISVHFFDTSGSPLFEEVRSEFYHDMQGILLAYDVTDRSSFIALDAWLAELRHNLGPPHDWKVVVIVCATKSDVAAGRQVTETDGKAWAEQHQFTHISTSANLGNNITQVFHTLFMQALQMKEGIRPSPATIAADPEALQAIHRLIHSADDFDKIGVSRRGISKEEINKAYRKLAGMVHPDKCKAPGAEEAFKALTQARNNLLKVLHETTV